MNKCACLLSNHSFIKCHKESNFQFIRYHCYCAGGAMVWCRSCMLSQVHSCSSSQQLCSPRNCWETTSGVQSRILEENISCLTENICRHDSDSGHINDETFNSYCYIHDTFTLAEEQRTGYRGTCLHNNTYLLSYALASKQI